MSLPQDKNDYIDGSISGISGINDDENNNSNHVAHNESNINNSAFIATDDYYSTSSSDKSERNKSIEVSVVFASEDYNSKNNDDSIIIKSSPTVAKKKKKKKKKKLSSNANKDTERVNPSSVKPKDNEEEEEQGVGCNNKEVAVLVLPPSNKNAVDFNINTNNGSSSTIIGKSNNDILGIVHSSDSISEEGRDNNGGRNKNVAEQPVLYNNEDDGSSSTFSSKPYPADTYSLLSLHGPVGNPGFFSYGLMVYLFQMTFLVLMVLSVIHPDWSSNGDGDNRDYGGRESLLARLAEFVPSNVSPLVRATQITATLSYVIFADSTMLDVVTAVELFPNFKQATSDDKLGCMVFASILRLSQGIFAITVTLLLIVTSSTTIEIILNFTAINFISTLDNVGFELIKWGKYGPKFEEEAKRIEKLPFPRCLYRKYKHVRYLCTIIPIGVILFSMICYMIILQESNNHWVTKIFCVQFQDKEQGLQVYNGCYEKNETAINRYKGFRRKLYEGVGNNAESAKFGYCIDDRRWILFNGDNANACEAGVLARSSKTDTFDVSTMFDETWYSNMNIPVDLFFCEFYDERENQCVLPDNGICNLELNSIDFRYDGGDCCAVFSYHFYTSHISPPNALDSNDFTGSIPSEIGLITSLEDLYLNSNDLTGTIPSEMGLLTLLEYLDLGHNDLTGTIPSEIGLMTSLTSLSFDNNDLTGTIPSEIGWLTSLEYLHLGKMFEYPESRNDLTGTIPSEIGLMTSLTSLFLYNNDLTGTIPSEIGWLTSLEYLHLGYNALTGSIPSEIGLMTYFANFYFLD